jgi:hypothetical protein
LLFYFDGKKKKNKGVQENKQGNHSCPFCRQGFTRETLFPAPLSIRNKLDELKSICVFCYQVSACLLIFCLFVGV